MSRVEHLPYILRREPFGGIAFDPADGTMLELDHEAYAVARATLRGRGFFFDRAKRDFAREFKASFGYDRLRRVRLIDDGWATATETPTFSAPTLVDLQITERCNTGCPHCYASAITGGEHVAWDDLRMVVDQLHDCGVCQLAIGGGEPLLHPNLVDLLALCHDRGIVPNLTTAGNEFTRDNLRAISRSCGAIGMSLEGVGPEFDRWRRFGFERFRSAILTTRDAGIPTVLQITLSAANLPQLDEMVDFCLGNDHLYGVIFLAYKNVGRGTHAAASLGSLPPAQVSAALKRAFDRLSPVMRVGYDCCMTPGIAGVEAEHDFVDATHLQGCSATRGSVGISAALDVVPCTFTGGYALGNLRQRTLKDIWRGASCEAFRDRIHTKSVTNHACGGCAKRGGCLGGCPVFPLINCHRDHLDGHEFPGQRRNKPEPSATR